MKMIEERSNFKKDHEAIQHYATTQAIETDPWCDVCGGDDHSGNHCPETKEDVNFIIIVINNNGYRSQQQQGWNSHPFCQGNGGKIPSKPKEPIKSVNLVTTRFGKPPLRSRYGHPRRETMVIQQSRALLDLKNSTMPPGTLAQVSASCPSLNLKESVQKEEEGGGQTHEASTSPSHVLHFELVFDLVLLKRTFVEVAYIPQEQFVKDEPIQQDIQEGARGHNQELIKALLLLSWLLSRRNLLS
uniref:Uncharacterized protein n=2 Tax=Oryza sativa subsp. japonica TaxID=39947 RepID=Q8H8A2_ORYSJ|nr:Hypothetical protein [Oryza sativa Japonica Group]AAP52003.1 hypothetical protein LOC_Os10g04210 [Oryza sativa Japonica Group]